MQEDKKLKELLMQHAVEETGADFTGAVMQRIEAMQVAKQRATSLLQEGLWKVLIAAFAVVCVVLLATSITMQPSAFPFTINIQLPATYFSQVIYFLISFWIVMLVNEAWNKNRGFFQNKEV